MVSTRLYPEWPLFATPHVSPDRVRRVTAALLQLEPDSVTTRAIGIHVHLHTDGSQRTIEVSLLPLDTSSRPAILGVWHDIIERDRAHQLIASQLALFPGGPVIVFEWAPPLVDWPILSVSRNVTAELGYTPDEMADPGFKFAALMHPDDIERIRRESQVSIASGKTTWEQSYRLRRKSGEYAWYYDFTQAVFDDDGGLLALRGYLIDQTATKQLELQLAQERKSLLNILWGTGVGTWEWNVQTGETRFNERWAQIIGFTLDEFAPVSIDTWLAHLPDAEAAQPLIQRLLEDIAKPATILGHQVQVSASIGVSFFTCGADSNPETLLRQADLAMYDAQSSGKNRISVFRGRAPIDPDSTG